MASPQKDNKGRKTDMETYEPLDMEVIAFDAEDVIVTSGGRGWTNDQPIPGLNNM